MCEEGRQIEGKDDVCESVMEKKNEGRAGCLKRDSEELGGVRKIKITKDKEIDTGAESENESNR